MKPIEMERKSEWRELRRKVFYQAEGVHQTYKVGTKIHNASQAIRNLAKKYNLKVSITEDYQSIIVYKHESEVKIK